MMPRTHFPAAASVNPASSRAARKGPRFSNATCGISTPCRVVRLNRLHYRLPNLDFMLWDYRQGKPNDLEPADLLLCGLGTNNDCPPGAYATLNPLLVRKAEGYQREKYEAIRYFRNWRRAAKNGALLLTILRVFTFPRLLAFIDAAQEADWTPLFEQFAFVPCPWARSTSWHIEMAATHKALRPERNWAFAERSATSMRKTLVPTTVWRSCRLLRRRAKVTRLLKQPWPASPASTSATMSSW